MEDSNISNNKFLTFSIILVTLVGLSGFLIGLGLNQGDCPVCSDKKVVKVFTTLNNIEDDVDYNMVTSAIKRELVGKYLNKNDSKTYLEILKDGTFELSLYNENEREYTKYTNEVYVLLAYYSKQEVETEIATATIDNVKQTKNVYKTTLYFIPKGKIEGDLMANIITFTDIEETNDGISDILTGPLADDSKIYVKSKVTYGQ